MPDGVFVALHSRLDGGSVQFLEDTFTIGPRRSAALVVKPFPQSDVPPAGSVSLDILKNG